MAKAGEVWVIDLGMVAKVRPCLLLTDYPANDELAVARLERRLGVLTSEEWDKIRERLADYFGL